MTRKTSGASGAGREFSPGSVMGRTMGRDDISMTEAELQLVRQRSGRVNWLLAIAGNFGIASLTVPAAIFGFALGDGVTRYLYTALFAVLLGSPVTFLAMLASRNQEAATTTAMDSL